VPGKELYAAYLDHLVEQLGASGVEVRTSAPETEVRAAVADAAKVFWAGGAEPRRWNDADASVPVVGGWEMFFEPLAPREPRTVFVVGAGQVGCDAAILLAAEGHAVTLCDQLEAPLAAFRARQHDYQDALDRLGVRRLFGAAAERAEGAAVVTRDASGTTSHRADLIVVAVGRVSRPVPEYAGEAVRIGDAAKVGSALEAIRQGTFHAAFATHR
jgi:pyruvate/2-oxoglutarate dehydrogenase complex dihydrolipoamide dehydrogenase (E3) component